MSFAEQLFTCRSQQPPSEPRTWDLFYHSIEEKYNTGGFPVAAHTYQMFVGRCVGEPTDAFEFGLGLFKSTALLQFPVAADKEAKCVALTDPKEKTECFKGANTPTDRFAWERLSNVREFLGTVAQRELEAFIASF